MDDDVLERAVAAATSLAGSAGLTVDETTVIGNSNKLALRLLPCEVFARIAPVGHEVAAFEIEIAQALASAPVVALEPRVEPRVYVHDGFAVTFWTYYESMADRGTPADYATALRRLHAAMRNVRIDAPHCTDRIADAERLLTHEQQTPALAADDRRLLLDILRAGGGALRGPGSAQQLLHGEPHAGNLLDTSDGLLFIDFETCCRGPVEFDVAHVPDEVSLHYPDIDRALLDRCRQLVLAMVAAWRWDVLDEYPDGQRHGRNIVRLLRHGPPWPTLDALSIE